MSLEKGAFFPLTCKRVVVVVVVVVPFRGHTLPCHLRQCHFSGVQIQGEILGPGETVISIFNESFFFWWNWRCLGSCKAVDTVDAG